MIRWRAGAALLLLAAAGWLLWPAPRAPEVTFKLIDGRQLTTTALQGRTVLVNFWATSCPSCVAEVPDLVTLHRDYGARGLAIIGVAMPHDPPNRVVEFVAARQLPYAIALDLDASLVRAFGDVRLTPTHVLIGPDGRVVARHTGPLQLASTRRQLERLLKES